GTLVSLSLGSANAAVTVAEHTLLPTATSWFEVGAGISTDGNVVDNRQELWCSRPTQAKQTTAFTEFFRDMTRAIFCNFRTRGPIKKLQVPTCYFGSPRIKR